MHLIYIGKDYFCGVFCNSKPSLTCKSDKYKMRNFFLLLAVCVSFQVYSADKNGWKQSPECGFYSERPASKWEEFLLSGNGTMGVMVAGRPYHEQIVFNHTNLFMPIFDPLIPPSQGNHLEKIRQMMLDDKYQEAAQFLVETSHADGFGRKRQSDLFVPAFRLEFSADTLPVRKYKRQVDFNSGEINVAWQDKSGVYNRKTFVSRTDNVIVVQMEAEGDASINTSLDLSMITTHEEKRKIKFGLDDQYNIKKVEKKIDADWLLMKVWYKKPWKGGYQGYEGAIKVVQDGGTSEIVGGKLVVKGAKSLLLVGRVEPSKDLYSSLIAGFQASINKLPTEYDALLAKHRPVHHDLMGRVSLHLGADKKYGNFSSEKLLDLDHANPAVIEKLFNAARYHIISSTGVNPPNLQGIWGATMTPPWAGDYTTNGNLPTAVSHFLDASTPELMLPLFNKLESFMDYFKTNARVLFNCRGIHIPSHICLHGYDNQFDATWPMTFWTAGAAWYAMFYYDYYLYTLDKDFLKNRAFPFMEQAAMFYEDFLTLGEDGKYVFNPSYSPENNPGNSKSQACVNATMDVMAAKALFRDLIAASKILSIRGEKVELWESMLERMPSYQLNEEGELREWMWKELTDNHQHRHASHLLGLFYQRDPEIMSDERLKEGCRKVIEQRMNYRRSNKDGGVMAFGISQLAFAACALGDASWAHELLVYAADNYWNNNLMTTHDSHAIFNADMSGAYPAMVLKMLAYSESGLISLLPACPWKEGFLKGMSLRGGVYVKELSWDAEGIRLSVISSVEQTVRLEIRGDYVKELTLPAKELVEFHF